MDIECLPQFSVGVKNVWLPMDSGTGIAQNKIKRGMDTWLLQLFPGKNGIVV